MNPKFKFAIALFILGLGFTLACDFLHNIMLGGIIALLLIIGVYLVVDTFYRWPDNDRR